MSDPERRDCGSPLHPSLRIAECRALQALRKSDDEDVPAWDGTADSPTDLFDRDGSSLSIPRKDAWSC